MLTSRPVSGRIRYFLLGCLSMYVHCCTVVFSALNTTAHGYTSVAPIVACFERLASKSQLVPSLHVDSNLILWVIFPFLFSVVYQRYPTREDVQKSMGDFHEERCWLLALWSASGETSGRHAFCTGHV